MLLDRAHLHRQARERRLDQEPRLGVTPHLAVEVKQRIEHGRQSFRGGPVVSRQRRHQPIAAPLHEPAHHLPELRAGRVNPIQLRERFRCPALEHVVQQLIKETRIGDPQQRTRTL